MPPPRPLPSTDCFDSLPLCHFVQSELAQEPVQKVDLGLAGKEAHLVLVDLPNWDCSRIAVAETALSVSIDQDYCVAELEQWRAHFSPHQ
jgi:hypothetical protein